MANHLGAADDLQALRAWLATHAHSGPTHRAYAKEVERFYLWCLHARAKPLSAVDTQDAQAYRLFLAHLPPDWVNPRPAPRTDPAWRPFRGPLSAGSVKYALGVLQTLYDGLNAAGHLTGNPMRGVGRLVDVPARAQPLARSFTDAEWAFVLGQLALQTAARATARPVRGQAEALRIRLLLELLASTGLRLAEMAAATMDDIAWRPVAGSDAPAAVLRVPGPRTGRRRAPAAPGPDRREVPVPAHVLALIAQHQRDAAEAVGCALPSPLPSPLPIVCTLGEAPRRWVDGEGGTVALSPPLPPALRPLGPMGIYLTLKRFFRRIAEQASAVDGLSRERMMAASTHWLRHTFGRQGAAAGVPVEALQRALGHASLASTSQYLAADSAGQGG
jgi:site-specific recombinase XerD